MIEEERDWSTTEDKDFIVGLDAPLFCEFMVVLSEEKDFVEEDELR